jgi:hypothetical protein
MITVARLGVDDQLVEVTQIPGDHSGLITRERDGDRLWVIEQPDTLHELDLDGTLLSSTALGVPNIESTFTLTSFEGELIRTYTLTDQDGVTLERRSVAGELRWSLALGELVFDGLVAEVIRSPAVRDGALTMLAYDYSLDSAAVTFVALDPDDGTPLWDSLLIADDFGGPYFWLGGLEESVVVEVSNASDDPYGPNHMRLFAVDGAGGMLWERSVELPELPPVLTDASVVSLGGDLVIRVRGFTTDIEPRAGLVRIPADGGVPCWMPLDPLVSPSESLPWSIGGGRIIVGQNDDPAPMMVIGDGVGGCVDDP